MCQPVWLPLESNPETINPFLSSIGVSSVECVDVFSFDDDCVAQLPKPQLAMLLCFPDDKAKHILEPLYEKMRAEGVEAPSSVFFMKQKINNACGTFALFHALANNEDNADMGTGPFRTWLTAAKGANAETRSDLLAGAADIASAHEAAAKGGETATPDADKVEHHFIAFVNVGGTLYEIDSCAPQPRPLGATSGDTLVADAGRKVQEMMKQMEGISFSALALVKK